MKKISKIFVTAFCVSIAISNLVFQDNALAAPPGPTGQKLPPPQPHIQYSCAINANQYNATGLAPIANPSGWPEDHIVQIQAIPNSGPHTAYIYLALRKSGSDFYVWNGDMSIFRGTLISGNAVVVSNSAMGIDSNYGTLLPANSTSLIMRSAGMDQVWVSGECALKLVFQ